MSFAFSLLILGFSFVTSIISGVLGMAGGILLMGLLAWVLPVQQAMVMHAITQFFANISRAIIHRRHIFFKTLGWYAAGLATVFALFMAIGLVVSQLTVFLLMGAMPYLVLLLPKNTRLTFTRPADAFLCGLTSMFLQLTAGTVGGIFDVFFQDRTLTRHQAVATKSFVQTIAHSAKFVYFSMIVSTLPDTFRDIPAWLCLAVIPLAIAGSHIGKMILEKMTDHHFYRLTRAVVLGIAAVYLIKAFLLWQA